MKTHDGLNRWRSAWAVWALALLAILQGCSTPPAPPAPPEPSLPPAVQVPSPAPVATRPAEPETVNRSWARTPRDYRRDAAQHLYERQHHRIYKGRLPPMLYAVGVLNVDIDRRGQVQAVHWMRAPRHAPEVMAEIEKMVRSAAPYPAPERMDKVTYTDVWLWHKSGKFQLDTLTEGQD